MADTKTDTKPESTAPESTTPPEGAKSDERAGAVADAQAKAAEAAKETKVVRRFADGSSEWTTLGELEGTHGDPTQGPSTADLNPAYSPLASTHAGAVE